MNDIVPDVATLLQNPIQAFVPGQGIEDYIKELTWIKWGANKLQRMDRSWYKEECSKLRWITEQQGKNDYEQKFYEKLRRVLPRQDWYTWMHEADDGTTLGSNYQYPESPSTDSDKNYAEDYIDMVN